MSLPDPFPGDLAYLVAPRGGLAGSWGWLATWCCSMDRLWSCRLSTSFRSRSPATSARGVVKVDNNSCVTCTWLEENDGLQTSELCGVNIQILEQVHDGAELGEGRGEGGGQVGELAGGEDGGGVEREAPLDGAQQEQLGPALLQQHGLASQPRSRVTCHASHVTWSLGARAEKEARFLVHLTDMKRSLAAVSYTVSAAAADDEPPSCPHTALPASSSPDSGFGESEALLVLALQSGHGQCRVEAGHLHSGAGYLGPRARSCHCS